MAIRPDRQDLEAFALLHFRHYDLSELTETSSR